MKPGEESRAQPQQNQGPRGPTVGASTLAGRGQKGRPSAELDLREGPSSPTRPSVSAVRWSLLLPCLRRRPSSAGTQDPGPSRPLQAPAWLGGRAGWGQGGDPSSPGRGGRQAQAFPGRQGRGDPLPASKCRRGQKAAPAGEGRGLRAGGTAGGTLEGRPEGWPERVPADSKQARPWVFRGERGRVSDSPETETGWSCVHCAGLEPGRPRLHQGTRCHSRVPVRTRSRSERDRGGRHESPGTVNSHEHVHSSVHISPAAASWLGGERRVPRRKREGTDTSLRARSQKPGRGVPPPP